MVSMWTDGRPLKLPATSAGSASASSVNDRPWQWPQTPRTIFSFGRRLSFWLWVTDFTEPSLLIRVEEAFFLASPSFQSPMGLGLTAFAREENRDAAAIGFGGVALDWKGVRTLVAEHWPDGGPHREHFQGRKQGPAATSGETSLVISRAAPASRP